MDFTRILFSGWCNFKNFKGIYFCKSRKYLLAISDILNISNRIGLTYWKSTWWINERIKSVFSIPCLYRKYQSNENEAYAMAFIELFIDTVFYLTGFCESKKSFFSQIFTCVNKRSIHAICKNFSQRRFLPLNCFYFLSMRKYFLELVMLS